MGVAMHVGPCYPHIAIVSSAQKFCMGVAMHVGPCYPHRTFVPAATTDVRLFLEKFLDEIPQFSKQKFRTIVAYNGPVRKFLSVVSVRGRCGAPGGQKDQWYIYGVSNPPQYHDIDKNSSHTLVPELNHSLSQYLYWAP
jgi:hypothetical protein